MREDWFTALLSLHGTRSPERSVAIAVGWTYALQVPEAAAAVADYLDASLVVGVEEIRGVALAGARAAIGEVGDL